MESRRIDRNNSFYINCLSLCCPEAQADGVPCPALGRPCETCERALSAEITTPAEPVRPVGND